MKKLVKFIIPIVPTFPFVYGIFFFLSNKSLSGEETIKLLNSIFLTAFSLIILQFSIIMTLCFYRIFIKNFNLDCKDIRILNMINKSKFNAFLVSIISIVIICVCSWNMYNANKHFKDELNTSKQDWVYINPYFKN